MDARELRIGNWIICSNDMASNVIKVNEWVFNSFDFGHNKFLPIPLTEEWLLAFGFTYDSILGEQNQTYWDNYSNDRIFSLAKYDEGLFFEDIVIDHKIFRTEIKYVHQLQNLYFALTSQELTLK